MLLTKNEIFVTFEGPVPNLFLEGKGVVAEGKLADNNYFIANKILAKHDENYKPPNDGNKNNVKLFWKLVTNIKCFYYFINIIFFKFIFNF